MMKICSNSQDNMKILYLSLKLYLYALNSYASRVDDEAEQIITSYINDVQACLMAWLRRPDFGFGNHFGGKNANKIKDEVKVCEYCRSKLYILHFLTNYNLRCTHTKYIFEND